MEMCVAYCGSLCNHSDAKLSRRILQHSQAPPTHIEKSKSKSSMPQLHGFLFSSLSLLQVSLLLLLF